MPANCAKLSGRPGSSASIQRVTEELNGHRVDIDAVEAAADDVAQSSPGGLRRRLVVVRSH
jgi:hypothetical protein